MRVNDTEAQALQALSRQMASTLKSFHTQVGTKGAWEVQDQSPCFIEGRRLERQYGPGERWTARPADYAADAAFMFLLAQSDHLALLQQSYETYAGLTFGVGPVARSILEINGYVYWLLHPDIGSFRTRGSRVLLSQLNDASREVSAAKAVEAPPKLLDSVGKSLGALKRSVSRLFFPSEIGRDGSGKLLLRGEKHPGPGEALRFLQVVGGGSWNSGGAYSLLSNASHPTLHTISDTLQSDTDGNLRFGTTEITYHHRLARMVLAGFLTTWQISAAYRGVEQKTPRSLMRDLELLPEP